MKTVALRGRVVTDYEVWPEGTVLLEGSRIADVSREPLGATEVHEYPDRLIMPGFVDLQVNGSFGVDVATEPERVPELSKKLVVTGTTAFLPTVISSPATLYREALPRLADLTRKSVPGAEVLGVHLEGPFISPKRKSAHSSEHIAPADANLLAELLDLRPVRMLTLAPELEGAAELTKAAVGREVIVSAGHSNATFELAYEAFEEEIAGVTHLFNAMNSLHHRKPGLPGAAFAHPRVACGIIADGLHVHPALVNLAFRVLGPDRLYLATDTTAAAGAEQGEYSLAARRIHAGNGAPTLENGALAGSVLAMNEALQNALHRPRSYSDGRHHSREAHRRRRA
jgi:N-acetylglucosamine-6-phosphate deacetylase